MQLAKQVANAWPELDPAADRLQLEEAGLNG